MYNKWFYIAGLVLVAILLMVFDFTIKSRTKYSTTSAYSTASTGASIFFRLAEGAPETEATIKRSAVLSKDDLAQVDLFVLFSPRQPISRREAKLLDSFVREGGSLLLSFESERSWRHLSSLFLELDIDVETGPDGAFQNKALERLRLDQPYGVLEQGKEYAFYGRVLFDDEVCERHRIRCFYRNWAVGSGTVSVFAGLPPIGNVLISRLANRDIAFNLLNRHQSIVFDEYRHFFSDKTLGDLLLEPGFSLPLIGLALGALGFFLFGYSDLHEAGRSNDRKRKRLAYHDLNSSIFLGLLERFHSLPAALARQRRDLEHLFPRRKKEITETWQHLQVTQDMSDRQCMDAASLLLQLHKDFLAEKGFNSKKQSGRRSTRRTTGEYTVVNSDR